MVNINIQKEQRNELTLDKKIALLNYLKENGSSERKAAMIFRISKTTINRIKNMELSIRDRFEKEKIQSFAENVKKLLMTKLMMLFYFGFKKMRSINARISDPMIQEAALEFSKRLNINGFEASNGWLDKFKILTGILQKILNGDSNEVKIDSEINFKENFHLLRDGFDKKDIINADECGMFHRALPNKSLVQKGDRCKNGKQSKERLTVLLAASCTGEKLRPLVIGKYENPRCFKNIKKSTFAVNWRSSQKAWMNSIIYLEWLKIINLDMSRSNRKILLFVDNCPVYPMVNNLSNVTIKYLPPNTTSKLQPLEQGVIKAFKGYYRKEIFKSIIISQIDEDVKKFTFSNTKILDAIKWIYISWNSVKTTIIINFFQKAGFIKTNKEIISNEKIDCTLNVEIDHVIFEEGRFNELKNWN